MAAMHEYYDIIFNNIIFAPYDMTAVLVSSSTPLIHLCRLGKIPYLKKSHSSVVIPPSVKLETIDAGKREGFEDAVMLEGLLKEGWLSIGKLSPKSRKIISELTGFVGKGEGEAVALAYERKTRLLIDDEKGRRAAEAYGVTTITTLGMMLELKINGTLSRDEYRRNVRNYAKQGWVTADVLERFLENGD